ncbi:hypothetical protein JZ751_029592 [Albula glossodonta]|uniref:Uncharacterized protein n=1 Tax=Albula glossodonta TaxID=121402 RepID=A0A8T2MQF8_9TELE|nr:hypothetical protein JZ751_029592 [Albula glossodonta]
MGCFYSDHTALTLSRHPHGMLLQRSHSAHAQPPPPWDGFTAITQRSRSAATPMGWGAPSLSPLLHSALAVFLHHLKPLFNSLKFSLSGSLSGLMAQTQRVGREGVSDPYYPQTPPCKLKNNAGVSV